MNRNTTKSRLSNSENTEQNTKYINHIHARVRSHFHNCAQYKTVTNRSIKMCKIATPIVSSESKNALEPFVSQ